MARKPAMSIDFDASEADAALGVVMGITTAIKTERFTGSVLSYTHGMLANEFDMAMDMAVQSDPNRYNHVYDWSDHGGAGNRLWKHVLKGRGANREATFTWRASKKPIPTPMQYKEMGDKNFSLISDEELNKLSGRRYIFRWKAPVMEYSLKVTISPRWSDALFIPTGNADKPFVVTRSQVVVDDPGGGGTTGQFSAFWVNWWQTAGSTLFEQKVRRTVEEDLGKTPLEQIVKKRRGRVKGIGLSTFARSDYAFESGKEYAQAYIFGKAKSYDEATRYVERNW